MQKSIVKNYKKTHILRERRQRKRGREREGAREKKREIGRETERKGGIEYKYNTFYMCMIGYM